MLGYDQTSSSEYLTHEMIHVFEEAILSGFTQVFPDLQFGNEFTPVCVLTYNSP